MNCSNHGEREAIGMCVRCRKIICEECKVKINNKYYCKDCVSEMYSNNSSNNYNNTSSTNKEKVKEYADKVVNATVDVTNDALNLVKDFSKSDEFKNTVNKARENQKIINYVLGIIAIVLLIPKFIDTSNSMPYFLDELVFSFRYYGVFRGIFYLINIIATLVEPLVIIVLATLLFNNFMKLKRNIRVIAPIVIVVVFTLIRLISAQISLSYINFHIIGNIFSYFIPVLLIVIGSYLDKEDN